MADYVDKLKLNVEIVMHFIVLVVACGVLVMVSLQAMQFASSKLNLFMGAMISQAIFIGMLIFYMIYNIIFKNKAFFVSSSTQEVVVIMLVVIIFATIIVALKLTVFSKVNTMDPASIVLVGPVQPITTAMTLAFVPNMSGTLTVDQRSQTDFISNQSSEGGESAFTLTMWIGLDTTTMKGIYSMLADLVTAKATVLKSDDNLSYQFKIPLFIRGIPQKWWVKSGLNQDNKPGAETLLKCPIIWLVFSADAATAAPLSPYFEVEFNHMEDITHDPLTNIPNTCYVKNKYTAQCNIFQNAIEMDVRDQLKLGSSSDVNAMHQVTFVFQEQYVNSSISTVVKSLYTKISVYIDGTAAKRDSYFNGQMRLTSSSVMALPKELMNYQTNVLNNADSSNNGWVNKVTQFLQASRVGGVVYYSYAMSPNSISSLYSAGYSALPATASNAISVIQPPTIIGNTDRDVVTVFAQ